MDKRIVIVGANQGGALLAEFLGKQGFEVTVFERSKCGEVSYDWHDDMNPSVYKRVGIEPLSSEYSFPKGHWSFIPPTGSPCIKITQDEHRIDLSTERRALSSYLYNRASKVADFRFETEVSGLIISDNAVRGVVLADGSKVECALVVDCSGAMSVLRASLPEDCGIQRILPEKELFTAYRGFYNRVEGLPDPEHTNKAYLKHLGEEGISWCIWDVPSNTMNVLVGRIGIMSKDTFDHAFEALKRDNPLIGDTLVRGGEWCTIPVRRPISRFAIDGYALLGDSAFMTIPMLGSGMASSMVAAKILSEVIAEGGDEYYSAKALYPYQVRFMREMGSRHTGVDFLKEWLLTADNKSVDFLFKKHVLSEEDLKTVCVGELLKLTPSFMIKKAIKGISNLPLLLKMAGMLGRVNRAVKLAASIPTEYDKDAFATWQNKYNSLFE